MTKHPLSILKYTFTSILLFLLLSSISAQTFTPKYNDTIADHSNGYYEYLPEGYSQGSNKYPLLIFCHGQGELGDGSVSQLSKVLANGTAKQINQGIFPKSFTVKGQTFRYLVVSPQFTRTPTSKDIDQIINYAIAHYRVDTTRIYLTGLSMGGGAVWNYVGDKVEYASRIAAVVPICGAASPAEFRCKNIATGDLPVWATHNDGDPTVPVSSTITFVNTINSEPNPPSPLAKKTIFSSNSHDAWTKTYDFTFKENGLNVYEWMLQFQRVGGVLPVSYLQFSVQKTETSAQLQWNTSSETNNKGFIIERSGDGNHFDSIAFVNSKSISGGDYLFQDYNPLSGKNYYRLKQVDFNGQFSYSIVRYAEINLQNRISIYPNPVGNVLQFESNFDLNNCRINIFDMSGKTVEGKVLSGSGSYKIPLRLPAGMYTAMFIKNGQIIWKESFIKK